VKKAEHHSGDSSKGQRSGEIFKAIPTAETKKKRQYKKGGIHEKQKKEREKNLLILP